MTHAHRNSEREPKLERFCAWLLAFVTFLLIWVGGLVTTTDAGMAFRDWLTSDGYWMPFYPWFRSEGDKFVEHGHRLLGMTAGLLSIALVGAVWLTDSRIWVRKLSIVILAGVVLQGILGGMRVVLDRRTLALVHGCTGPLFFALCVAMVVVSSRWWNQSQAINATTAGRKLFRQAMLCACLAYLQLIVGAVVRHSPHIIAPESTAIFQVGVYFHLLLALVLTIYVAWLAFSAIVTRLESRSGLLLLALIAMQLMLGIGTWLVKYGMPAWAAASFGEFGFVNRSADLIQASIITSHVAIGSLIFGVSIAITLRLGRQLRIVLPPWTTRRATMPEVAR